MKRKDRDMSLYYSVLEIRKDAVLSLIDVYLDDLLRGRYELGLESMSYDKTGERGNSNLRAYC